MAADSSSCSHLNFDVTHYDPKILCLKLCARFPTGWGGATKCGEGASQVCLPLQHGGVSFD